MFMAQSPCGPNPMWENVIIQDWKVHFTTTLLKQADLSPSSLYISGEYIAII